MHVGTTRLLAVTAPSTLVALTLSACSRDKAPTETETAKIVQAAMTNGSKSTPEDAYACASSSPIWYSPNLC